MLPLMAMLTIKIGSLFDFFASTFTDCSVVEPARCLPNETSLGTIANVSGTGVAVQIYRCEYVSQCKAPRCPERATLVAEKVDNAGRHVRQIELCDRHAQIVIARERARGLEILDRRDWR